MFCVLLCFETLLPDNTNPSTGEPYGEDFLVDGVLDLWGLCTFARVLYSFFFGVWGGGVGVSTCLANA